MFFNSTDELRQHVGRLQIESSFDILRPYVRQAEKGRIRPMLGGKLYNRLMAGLTADTLTDVDKKLLEWVLPCAANYAMFAAFPHINIKISGSGFTQAKGEAYERARKEDVAWAYEATADLADDQAEDLLLFLEENRGDYPDWPGSKDQNLLISSAEEFTEEVDMVGDSRRVFVMLRTAITDVENLYIAKKISTSYTIWLKENRGSLENEHPRAWDLCKKAASRLAMAMAIPRLDFKLENGTMSFSSFQVAGAKLEKIKSAEKKEIAQGFLEVGQKYLDDLHLLLETSQEEEFTLYKQSELHKPPSTSAIQQDFTWHKDEGGIFGVF